MTFVDLPKILVKNTDELLDTLRLKQVVAIESASGVKIDYLDILRRFVKVNNTKVDVLFTGIYDGGITICIDKFNCEISCGDNNFVFYTNDLVKDFVTRSHYICFTNDTIKDLIDDCKCSYEDVNYNLIGIMDNGSKILLVNRGGIELTHYDSNGIVIGYGFISDGEFRMSDKETIIGLLKAKMDMITPEMVLELI